MKLNEFTDFQLIDRFESAVFHARNGKCIEDYKNIKAEVMRRLADGNAEVQA